MDYTPISARRVLVGFSFTGIVAFFPLLMVYLNSHALPIHPFSAPDGGYGGVVLGIGSFIITMALVGLAALLFVAARRVVRRPTQA